MLPIISAPPGLNRTKKIQHSKLLFIYQSTTHSDHNALHYKIFRVWNILQEAGGLDNDAGDAVRV